MPSRSDSASGFTVLELVVSLALAGLILLMAHRFVWQVGAAAGAGVAESAAIDERYLAERLLRTVVRNHDAGSAGSEHRFLGEPRIARFGTWCDTPEGAQERCAVALAVVEGAEGPVLALSLPGHEIIVVRRGFGSGELRYLSDAGSGAVWARSWGESIVSPIGIGVVLDGDTLILRIGDRG